MHEELLAFFLHMKKLIKRIVCIFKIKFSLCILNETSIS